MKILIVDDHALIREALRGVLRQLRGETTILLEAEDAHQAMHQLEQNLDVELVVLDLALPDQDGFEMMARLADRHPTVSVVVLSGHQDRDRVVRALEAGALGFIPKTSSRAVMVSAFNLMFAGGIYVPPAILDRGKTLPAATPGCALPLRRPSAAALGLTERQMDVLALMMQGRSNKAICRELDLAEPTVKVHVSAVLRAFKASNRTEAVMAATELGVLRAQQSE